MSLIQALLVSSKLDSICGVFSENLANTPYIFDFWVREIAKVDIGLRVCRVLFNGKMTKELQFYLDDVAKFGDLPSVTVHNMNNMTKTQIQNVMKKDNTVIGAFCNSGACLKPLE